MQQQLQIQFVQNYERLCATCDFCSVVFWGTHSLWIPPNAIGTPTNKTLHRSTCKSPQRTGGLNQWTNQTNETTFGVAKCVCETIPHMKCQRIGAKSVSIIL